MGRISLAICAFALAACVGCGCGTSTKPLTRAELTAKANAICRTVSARVSSKTIKTQQDIARAASELASFEVNALAKLSKLVPPAELADEWKQFIAGAQELAENTTKLGAYAKNNDLKAGKELIAASEQIQQRMVGIARRNGLKDCEQVA